MSAADAVMRLDQVRSIIDAAFSGMTHALVRLGIAEGIAWMPPDAAACTLATDPSNGGQSLVGVWRDARVCHVGDPVVHADDSCYIEYGVSIPHPHKSGGLVDAIIAWGRDGIVKAEPRLLPPL